MIRWIYGVSLAIISVCAFSYWAGKRRGEQLTLRGMVPQLEHQVMQSQQISMLCGLLGDGLGKYYYCLKSTIEIAKGSLEHESAHIEGCCCDATERLLAEIERLRFPEEFERLRSAETSQETNPKSEPK